MGRSQKRIEGALGAGGFGLGLSPGRSQKRIEGRIATVGIGVVVGMGEDLKRELKGNISTVERFFIHISFLEDLKRELKATLTNTSETNLA